MATHRRTTTSAKGDKRSRHVPRQKNQTTTKDHSSWTVHEKYSNNANRRQRLQNCGCFCACQDQPPNTQWQKRNSVTGDRLRQKENRRGDRKTHESTTRQRLRCRTEQHVYLEWYTAKIMLTTRGGAAVQPQHSAMRSRIQVHKTNRHSNNRRRPTQSSTRIPKTASKPKRAFDNNVPQHCESVETTRLKESACGDLDTTTENIKKKTRTTPGKAGYGTQMYWQRPQRRLRKGKIAIQQYSPTRAKRRVPRRHTNAQTNPENDGQNHKHTQHKLTLWQNNIANVKTTTR